MRWVVFGLLLASSFLAGAPKWVKQCSGVAKLSKGNIVACGSADILDGDVDYAASMASAVARDKLADFVLKDQKVDSKKEVSVQLPSLLKAKWVDSSRVYVLLGVDSKSSKQVKVIVQKKPSGVITPPNNQKQTPVEQKISPPTKSAAQPPLQKEITPKN
ncbi:hypothetical protein [Helicobacter suis]|uniref:hypothetical protein n=1 Tax=Helicobacter suis TaxID=104628 RepID=UPI001F1BC95B|nr:hypothetical protein [Helicobacter suis]